MKIKLLDEHERAEIAEINIPDKARGPRIEHDGRFFEASRFEEATEDTDEAWIYRHSPRTK